MIRTEPLSREFQLNAGQGHQSGSGKGHPSQDRALQKTRRELGQAEKALRREAEKNEKLRIENERLKKEVEKLKKELAAKRVIPKWAKSNKSEADKKKAKKLGPKKGHKAHPRTKPEKIDFEVNLAPKNCPHCEAKLPPVHKWHSHIQLEIPEFLKTFVTKYNVGWCYCKHCKKEVSAKERVNHSKYGARLHAWISYCKFSLGLTLGKIQKLLHDQYRMDMSTGQISEIISRSAGKFEDYYDSIATSLVDQSHLHADESGWRVSGNNGWLWSFSNEKLTYYVINKSRSAQVVEDTLGKAFNGVLITDFYAAYNQIDCEKQKCWTHLLRELRELKQKYPASTEIQYFSSRLKKLFSRAIALEDEYHKGKNIDKRLDRLVLDTHEWTLKKHRHKELRRVAKRMWKYRNELYTFIKKPGVQATNNTAEREQRPAVLLRKISYCNRSDQGAQNQAILMSSIRSMEKQGQNFVDSATQHLMQH